MSVAAERRLPLVVLVVIGVLTALGPLSLDAYLPGLPALVAEFGASRSEVQLTLTACLVGIAAGQLVAGPWSDSVGRRLPLLLGAATYAVASVACALAPNLPALIGLRFVQGLTVAIGVVAARAIIRDSASGPLAVRYFAQLSTAAGLAPVAAPLLGSAMLALGGWRAVFLALGLLGVVLAVLVATTFGETLPPERRHPPALGATLRSYAGLLRDRGFTAYVGVGVLAAVTLFAYISGSSFVLQGQFGAEPWQFALAFSLNGVGIATLSQVGARFGARWGTGRVLRFAFATQGAGALGVLAVALLAPREPASIPFLMAAFFAIAAPMGLINPAFMARAMDHATSHAGTASAVIGASTFLVGGIVTSFTGLGDPVATIAVIGLVGSTLGLVLVLVLTRRERRRAEASENPEIPGGFSA